MPPKAFPLVIAASCRGSGPGRPSTSDAWRRVVIEKPFGHDLESLARAERRRLARCSPRTSVFRIDHYLGKETVQNLLALRFANQLFEPIWNANYVDHVQITMAEDIGIGGRAGYYDGIGAARDVIQNHLLQLLALTAMEEPVSFDAARPARGEGEGALARSGCPRTWPGTPPAGSTPPAGRAASRCAGYLEEDGIDAGLDHRDLRGDQAWTSTPAAGRACRSTCAPASGWAAG